MHPFFLPPLAAVCLPLATVGFGTQPTPPMASTTSAASSATWLSQYGVELAAAEPVDEVQNDSEPGHPQTLQAEQDPPRTELNPSLVYEQFAKAQRANGQARPQLDLYDFSFAGYHHGEVALPELSGPVLDITDFGALPNDGQDDAAAIQRAFTAAEAAAPCVVFFPPGRFQLGDPDGPPIEPLTMTASGVVLRGSGAGSLGEGGTELYMPEHLNATQPENLWTTPYAIQLGPRAVASGPAAKMLSKYKQTTHAIELDDAGELAAGDWVLIQGRTPKWNATWIAPFAMEPEWTRMAENGVQIAQRLQIESVEEHTVRLHAPLRIPVALSQAIDLELTVRSQVLGSEIGVEDLAFVGNWKTPFKHHKDDVHDGGWSLLQMQNVTNSWIARCRFTDVNRPWDLTRCANVSVLDSFTDGNAGHHATGLSEATNCLIAWYDDRAGHQHGPGVQARCAGNVFHQVTWTETNSFEAHANYPMLTLFDECHGALRYGHWGGDRRALPNHLGGLTFWNFEQTGAPTKDFEFWRNRKFGVHGRVVPPVIVGWFGKAESGTNLAKGQTQRIEFKGAVASPQSVWRAQLKLRLDELPAWLAER